MKLTYLFYAAENMFPLKHSMNNIYNLFTGTHKRLAILRGL